MQKSGATQADSDDIAQDILVKILEADIVLSLEKLRAWLYRTAVRAYIDKYRRDKRYHEILKTEFFTQEAITKYDKEDYQVLYEAVVELLPKYQHVIDCYYFQDMTVKEVAEVLGLSQAQVKIRLYRARKVLRALLIEKGFEDEDI